MKLSEGGFSSAIAGAASALYALCTLFVYLWPGVSATLMRALTHAKTEVARTITFGGFLLGILQVFIYVLVVSWIFAKIFNKYSQQ